MRSACGIAMALAWSLVVLQACAPRTAQRPDEDAFLGDTHASAPRPGVASRGSSRPVVRDEREARAWLERALADHQDEEVIRALDALVAVTAGADGQDQGARVLGAKLLAQLVRSVDALDRERAAALHRELHPWAPPAQVIAYRLAFMAEHRGDDSAARDWLERAAGLPLESLPTSSTLAQRVSEMRRRMRARARVAPGKVAVLLPLSGRFAPIGKELRLAITMAQAHDKGGTELVFLDTEGTTEGALAAVDRAIFDHECLAIIGPVGEREAGAAAARAARFGVPVALLAPGRAGGAASGVFRLWSSPAWEAREAVRVATSLGYDRLAVLAPRDEHGLAATLAFQEAAAAHSLELVAIGDYDPTASDLEPDIKAFLGLDPRSDPRLAAHLRRHGRKRGWRSFSPDVPFEMLYIPDEYQRASLVASYLPYFNVEVRTDEFMDVEYLRKKHRGRVPQVVQLLGSSGWHHPSLPVRGGSAVEGALVLDVYAGGETEGFSSEAAARFAEAFEQRVGRAPSAFSAQAYDAAALVLASARAARVGANRSRGASARAAMTRELAAARLDDGVCGPARMGRDGAVERAAIVLRVSGGTFELHEY